MKAYATIRTALAAALLGLGACSTEIWLSERNEPAILQIHPVDAAGTCVMGVSLAFTYPNGTTERMLPNPTECLYGWPGPPGEWSVGIAPPAGYALAAGQESVVRVRVLRRGTNDLAVRLVRTAP
jgi:hypothetical protein